MVGTILIRELKILLRNKTTFLMLIVMPAVLVTILGFALSGTFFSGNTWTDPINIAIVKQYEKTTPMDALKAGAPNETVYQQIISYSGEALESIDPEAWFFNDFLNNKDVKKMIEHEVLAEDKAKAALAERKISAIVYLGKNFITAGVGSYFYENIEPMTITVIGRDEGSFSYKLVTSLMQGFAHTINENKARQDVVIGEAEVIPPEHIAEVMKKALSESVESIKVNEISAKERPALSSFQYYAAAIMAMFLFYGAGIAGTRLLDEQHNHTWQRQITAGIRPAQLLLASVLIGTIIALVQMTVLISFSRLAFGVRWGSILPLALSVLSAAIAMGGINLFLAVITLRSGSFQIINAFRNLLVQVFALLGGSYLPVEILPEFFQKVSFFTLNGLAIKAWSRSMQGYTVLEIGPLILGMLGFALLFGILGILLYPRKGVNHG